MGRFALGADRCLIQIRVIVHSLGTTGAFCFIGSLHTNRLTLRSILHHTCTYLNVSYFILNAYVLWYSDEQTSLFDSYQWMLVLRSQALLCCLVSVSFALGVFQRLSFRAAFGLICANILLDAFILYGRSQSEMNFWILLDYLIDDVVMLCGYFYLDQFHTQQTIGAKERAD